MRDDHFGKWYSHQRTESNFDRLVPLALPKAFTVVVFTGKSLRRAGSKPLSKLDN
jgi:hypothetical protein